LASFRGVASSGTHLSRPVTGSSCFLPAFKMASLRAMWLLTNIQNDQFQGITASSKNIHNFQSQGLATTNKCSRRPVSGSSFFYNIWRWSCV